MLLFMVRTYVFIFLMFHLWTITSENHLVNLLYVPFQSMESHLTESCAMPDWAVLFTQTMSPCKPHWTAIPQDLVIKILEPFEFTAFTDQTFDWWHVLKLFWVSIIGFAWIRSVWWTTFKWLLAPLCYLYLECGIERYLARVRLRSSHPQHYHDVLIPHLWSPLHRRLSGTDTIRVPRSRTVPLGMRTMVFMRVRYRYISLAWL